MSHHFLIFHYDLVPLDDTEHSYAINELAAAATIFWECVHKRLVLSPDNDEIRLHKKKNEINNMQRALVQQSHGTQSDVFLPPVVLDFALDN